jgi:hypothetical protein
MRKPRLLPSWLAVCVAGWLGQTAQAADLGTVTHNGVTKAVTAAVGTWDPEELILEIALLFFEPTLEEAAEIQRGRGLAVADQRAHLDSDRWADWTPVVKYKMGWKPRGPEAVGDHGQALVALWVNNAHFSFSGWRPPEGIGGSLTGWSLPEEVADPVADPVAEPVLGGGPVTLVASGEWVVGEGSADEHHLAWDLRLSVPVLPKRPRR